jgi:hypothetical protein
MQLPRIIGLLARSRSGKDTVCDYIIAKYTNSPQGLDPIQSVVKRRLAQPIKDAVCALYGFTHDQLESDDKDNINPVIGISPRMAMVHITKSTMEQMGHDFFSRRLFNDIDSMPINAATIIIPDVRYKHDIHEIQKRGGILIKLERQNGPKYEWEHAIDDMSGNYTISNNGSIQELYAKVDAIFE